MRVKLVMFFCFPCVTCIFCFPTKYNQHIAMISRNLSHHPNIPPRVISAVLRASDWSTQPQYWPLIGHCWMSLFPSKSDHNPQPRRFSSLSKKCSQGPTFYDKEINISRHPPQYFMVDHFMLGRKLADKILQQKNMQKYHELKISFVYDPELELFTENGAV